jgi:hypothetical protein
MVGVGIGVAHPGEPPDGVVSEILWRVAVRLFRDHQPGPADAGAPTCAACGRRWPCSGVRMAELGLSAAKG